MPRTERSREEPERPQEREPDATPAPPASRSVAGAAPAARALTVPQVLQMQRGAGNAAVARQLAGAPAAAEPAGAPGALVVEDDAQPSEGQMTRSEFVTRLRPGVSGAAQRALAASPWGMYGEAVVSDWLQRMERLDAQALNRSLREAGMLTPEIRQAEDLLPRVVDAVEQRVRADVAGGAGAAAAAPEADGGDVLSLKAAGPTSARDAPPAAVRGSLGSGSDLPADLRTGIGAAMQHDFGGVRIHTDARAGQVARELGARAFTVGSDIGFAPGEFQPGTLVGDALIAHELAHVVQQEDGRPGVQAKGGIGDRAAEEDADLAAVGAMAWRWPAVGDRLARFGRAAIPRLRTGMQLQLNLCGPGSTGTVPAPPAPVPAAPVRPPDQHAGMNVPTSADQNAILQQLDPNIVLAPPPAPVPGGPVPAGPVPVIATWDGRVGQPNHAARRALLKRDLIRAMNRHLNDAMRNSIRPTMAQPRLPIASFEGPGRAAKRIVDRHFDSWMVNAARTPSQSAARHGFQFRTAPGPNQTLFDAFDPAARAAAGSPIDHEDLARWIAMHDDRANVVRDRHHFDPGQGGSDMEDFFFNDVVPAWAPPGSNVRRDLELYDRFGFALTSGANRDKIAMFTGATVIPGGAVNPATGLNTESERATRWSGWMTLIHEYIHTLEHPTFTASRSAGPSVMNEGFCEMFTKEVIDAEIGPARSDAALRTEVEGTAYPDEPSEQMLPLTYHSPADYVADRNHALNIRARIHDGVKAAYFQGHVELLGIQPGGTAIPPGQLPSAAGEVTVPPGIADVAALAAASGVPEADIRTANPGLPAAGLPPRVNLPGCREHTVVSSQDATGVTATETKAQIASQNGLVEADLDRANPSRNWAALRAGDKILIPRH